MLFAVYNIKAGPDRFISPQGIPGVDGKNGADGITGEKGSIGEKGSVGEQGIQGVIVSLVSLSQSLFSLSSLLCFSICNIF